MSACTNFPCDFAYQRREHRPGQACAAGWLDDMDHPIRVWSHSDGPDDWSVAVAIGDEVAIIDLQRWSRLVGALVNAQETATEGNLR